LRQMYRRATSTIAVRVMGVLLFAQRDTPLQDIRFVACEASHIHPH
jgi:hypothetical protein